MLRIKLNQFHQMRSGSVTQVTQFAVGLLCLILLIGCTTSTPTSKPTSNLADRSFISGEPCEAPCWYGLELDKSTENDVQRVLQKLLFVDPSSIKVMQGIWLDGNNSSVIKWDCIYPRQINCGNAWFSPPGKLTFLAFSTGYYLNFQSVVDKLGPPDEITEQAHDPRVSSGCNVSVIWNKRGIMLLVEDEKGKTNCGFISRNPIIFPETEVASISYFSQETLLKWKQCCKAVPWQGFSKK